VNAGARPFLLLAAPVVAAAFVAVAWQSSSVGASRPAGVKTRVETQTQTRVETRVVQDASAVAQLTQQVTALQQAVAATNQTSEGMAAQLSALKSTLTTLQGAITSLQQGVGAAQGASAAQTKKVNDLTAGLAGVDQRLWALQAQFDAQLRKLQPSPAPSPPH